MALTLQQVRTLPAFADMSDSDIISHASSNGFDTSAMMPDTSNEAGAFRSNVSIPLLKGIGDIGGSIGYGLEAAGLDKAGQYLQNSNEELQKTLTARQSQQAQADAQKTLIDDNGNYGGYNLGTLSQDVFGSLPGTVVMGVAGAPLAKVASLGSKALGLGSKLAEISSSGVLGKGLAAGLKAATIDTTLGSAVGFGASEGIYSGASNAAQIQTQIRNTDINTLAEHPLFADVYHKETDPSLTPDERLKQARDILATKAGDDVFANTAIQTGLISMATGGGVFGMLRGSSLAKDEIKDGVLKRAAKGFALEGIGQEAPQSALEQRTNNQALQDYALPNQDINQGVLNAGLQGGIAGGVMGLMGGAGGSPQVAPPDDKKQRTNINPDPNLDLRTDEQKAQDDTDLVNHANDRLATLNRKAEGTKDQIVTDPSTGKQVKIKGEWSRILSYDEMKERKYLIQHANNPAKLARFYTKNTAVDPVNNNDNTGSSIIDSTAIDITGLQGTPNPADAAPFVDPVNNNDNTGSSIIDSTAIDTTGLQGTPNPADAAPLTQTENINGSQESTSETQNANAQEEGLLSTVALEQSGATPNLDTLAEQLHIAIATDTSKQPDQHYADIVDDNKLDRQQANDLITKYQGIADQQQRQDEQANQQTETQAQDQTSADQSTAVTFQPTHELNDGTPVKQTGDNTYVDQAGDEWGADDAKPFGRVDTATTATSTEGNNTGPDVPSYATAPLLNKRTNTPFKTRKMAEVAIASSSNPTVNPQDHIAVPVDGGFGIVPKPNTLPGNNDTTTETQSVLSNTLANATGAITPTSTDVAGQASTPTAQEVVPKTKLKQVGLAITRAAKTEHRSIDGVGGAYHRSTNDSRRSDEIHSLTQTTDANGNPDYTAHISINTPIDGASNGTKTNEGKYSLNALLNSGAISQQTHDFLVDEYHGKNNDVIEANNNHQLTADDYVSNNNAQFPNSKGINDSLRKSHYTDIRSHLDQGGKISQEVFDSLDGLRRTNLIKNYGEDIIDAEAIKQPSKTQATETVAKPQETGDLSNNDQAKVPQVAQPTLMKRNVELHTVNGTVVKGDRYLFPGNERHPIIITKPSGNKGAATKQNHVAWDEISGSAIYMEPQKVYKDKPSAQHVIDVVSNQFNSGFGNKLDGHDSRIQIKAPAQETANPIHDATDVSKKGENVDTVDNSRVPAHITALKDYKDLQEQIHPILGPLYEQQAKNGRIGDARLDSQISKLEKQLQDAELNYVHAVEKKHNANSEVKSDLSTSDYLGKNEDDQSVHEDKNGKRYIQYENGLQEYESVSIVPSRNKGVEIKTNPRDEKFLTVNETKNNKTTDYGKNNKIFTEDAANAARARLKAKLGTLNSGFDPEMMLDGMTLAGYHIEAGAKKYADYTKAMINDLGDGIKPYLAHFYNAARDYPGFDKTGMASYSQLEVSARIGAHQGEKWSYQGQPAREITHVNENYITFATRDSNGKDQESYANFASHKKYWSLVDDSVGQTQKDYVKNEANSQENNYDSSKEHNTGTTEDSAGNISQAINQSGISDSQSKEPDQSRVGGSEEGIRPRSRQHDSTHSDQSKGNGVSGNEGLGGHQADVSTQHAVGREVSTDTSVSKSVGANNLSLIDKPAIALTPAKRRDVNILAEAILKKPVNDITEDDKNILRQYTGHGGLDVKASADKGEGIFNQHYSAYDTIKAMYGALMDAGVKMDNNLEPSVGSGNFIGMHPRANWTAVDIDTTNTEVVRRLYPDASVFNESYETFRGKNFDLIISNVPFASFSSLAREHAGTIKPAFKAIHNFFFAQSVDKLKTGGVMAFMTSTGTMDGIGEGQRLREHLIQKMDVIGAFRLPMGTQKANASTDVMIDVIFLQKRPEGVVSKQPEKNQSFVDIANKDGYKINQYFVDYPEAVLGDLSIGANKTSMGKVGWIVTGDADYSKMTLEPQDYSATVKSSRSEFATPDAAQAYADKKGLKLTDKVAEPFFQDGFIFDTPVTYSDVSGTGLFGRKATGLQAEKLAALKAIDEAHDAKLVQQYEEKYSKAPHTDKQLTLWAKVNYAGQQLKSYLALFDKHFNLSEIFTKQVRFKDSGKIEINEHSSLMDRAESLENADGIFSPKTELISADEIQDLLASGDYARLSNGSLQNARLYYAGNIYKKIDDATKVKPASQRDKQLAKLDRVKPDLWPIDKITFSGKESWLPASAITSIGIQNYADGTRLIGGNAITDSHSLHLYNQYINNDDLVKKDSKETPEEYADRLKAAQTHVHTEILPLIKQKILDDGLADEVVEAYNREKNFFAPPIFDGSSLRNLPTQFKGKPFQLMLHQLEGAERAIYNKKGVLAFSPGLGKTPTAIIVADQLLQKGVMKKPLFIVPANTIPQWESSTRSLYPDAKVYEFPKYKTGINKGKVKEWPSMTAADKEQMVYDLTNNQYDYTFISTNLAQKFSIPAKKLSQYLDELTESISGMEKPDEELNKSQIKAKETRIAKIRMLKATMMNAYKESIDTGFDMGKMGFDALFADEVQYYKNIGMQSEDAKGGIGANVAINAKYPLDADGKQDKTKDPLSVTLGSSRSYDFRFKTRFISENNNGNNIFLLTGTPTPNKPLELMTLLHHLDIHILDEYGIKNVGDFVNEFFDIQEVEETGIDGTNKLQAALVGIMNIPALKSIITRFIDYRSPESAKDLTRPKQIDKVHTILRNDASEEIFADVQTRILQSIEDAQAKKSGDKGVIVEPMIKMYGAGRDASIDVRLYTPSVDEKGDIAPGTLFEKETRSDYSKIAKTVELVAAKNKLDPEAGQLIFLDRLKFSGDNGSTHEDIRNDILKATGLDPKEVIFVSGQAFVNPDTGKQVSSGPKPEVLQKIMDYYNAGKIKVLIGNTSKLGVGVDLQVTTTDIYQIDKPYRPDEIEQRNNRGVRQGNRNSEVTVHTFNQPGTFDAMSDRIIANKQGFNDVFWKEQESDKADVKAEEAPSAYDAAIELEQDPFRKRKLEVERDLSGAAYKSSNLEKQISNLAKRTRTATTNHEAYLTANQGIDNRPTPLYEDQSESERKKSIAAFKVRMTEQRAKNVVRIGDLAKDIIDLNAEKDARQVELEAHKEHIASIRAKYVVNGIVSIDKIKATGDVKFSKSTTPVVNPHSKTTLNQAVTKAMDTLFGQGWTNRLMATGKFKMISAAEATGIIGKNAMFHKVWHGSPHDHNKFDSAYIDTGEGAQAFGWGHYFSDLKTVAEWYRDRLQNKRVKLLVDGKDVTELTTVSESRAIGILLDELKYPNMVSKNGLSEDQIKAIIDKVIIEQMPRSGENDPNWIKSLEKIRDYLTKLKSKKLEISRGKLYEVDLAPNQDEYLDWDKPMLEQSSVVKAAINRNQFKDPNSFFWRDHLLSTKERNITGGEFYKEIAGSFEDSYNQAPNDEAVSNYLHSIGIRGIRYKAEQGQSDANNYVVFNDADVKIEVKYSKNGDVIAFYNPADDTTYLVHDNITQNTSDKALQGLMLHEIGVHALTLGKSNEVFKDILRRFEALKATNPKVQAAFNRVPKDTKAEDIVEEALAYYLEENPKSSLAQRIIEWFRQAVRALGKTLPVLERAKFSQWANKLTEAELIGMATSALKSAPDSLQFDNVGRNREGIKLSYDESVDAALNGKSKGSLSLGETPLSLVKSGIPKLPLMITEKVIDKAHFDHGLSVNFLKSLPDLLSNPLMVFKSDTQIGSFVVITHETKSNNPVMVAIKPSGEIENIKPVNIITSAYGKPSEVIINWIKKGLLIASDKKLALAFATTNGVRFPTVIQSINKSLDINLEQKDKAVNTDNIKFSRSTPSNTPADNSAMRSFFAPAKGKQALGWLAGVFQRNHLIDFVAQDLPELVNYKLLSQAKDNFTNQRENKIGESYKEMMDKMDAKTMHELGRVQGMATRLVTFDPATIKSDGTPEQYLAYISMSPEQEAVYDAYSAMPEGAKEAYATMRDAYQADLMEKKRALIERIKAFPADKETQAEIIRTIEKHFDQFKEGVYFPLNRDGAVIVKATNQDGELVVEHVATQAAAYKLVQEMTTQGYDNTHIIGKDAYDRDLLAGNAANEMATLAHKTISDLKEKSIQGKLTESDFNDLFSEFNQLLINTLPDSSYRKHFIHRKGTLGESTDTLRAYSKTRVSAVKMIASLTYDHQIQDVLNNADKAIKEMDKVAGSDTLAIKSIVNELKLRESALKSTEINAVSQVLTSLGFIGALGLNIGSAAVNMLQVVGVALPELVGKHGYVEATKEISAAYKLLFNPANLDKASGLDITKNPQLTAIAKQAMEYLASIGKIDLTMTHDSIAAGKNPSYSSNPLTRAFGAAAKYSGYFFHVAEAANRQVTGMAAFNLAYQKNGGDFKAAIADAIDVIDRTQFDYGQGNRARYMMSNTARVLTLFKSYALGMSYFIGRNAYQYMKGETPEVRLQAKKTLIASMAMSFATAGLFGMPIGIEAFAAIGGVSAFKYKGAKFAVPGAIGGMLIFQALLAGLGADDEDELETEFRNWLTDNFDQTIAEWVTKGPARLLPIGDIAGRTSLSELWWRSQNKQLEGTDQYNAIATALIGPIGSQVAGLFTAKKMYEDGQYSRMVESMSPAFLRNAIAANRMGTEGVTNLKGDKIIQRDLTPVELINKVIGFNPTVVTNTYDANSAIAKESTKHTLAKSHLVNQWMSGDATERSDLMKGAIKDFNESVPPSERITLKSLFKSMRSRKGIDKHTQNGLYLSKKQNYLRDLGRFNRQE